MASSLGMGMLVSFWQQRKGPGSVSPPHVEHWVLNGLSRDFPHPVGFLSIRLAPTAEDCVHWPPWSILSVAHPGLGSLSCWPRSPQVLPPSVCHILHLAPGLNCPHHRFCSPVPAPGSQHNSYPQGTWGPFRISTLPTRDKKDLKKTPSPAFSLPKHTMSPSFISTMATKLMYRLLWVLTRSSKCKVGHNVLCFQFPPQSIQSLYHSLSPLLSAREGVRVYQKWPHACVGVMGIWDAVRLAEHVSMPWYL